MSMQKWPFLSCLGIPMMDDVYLLKRYNVCLKRCGSHMSMYHRHEAWKSSYQIMKVDENLSDIWLNSSKVNTNTAEVFTMAYNIFGLNMAMTDDDYLLKRYNVCLKRCRSRRSMHHRHKAWKSSYQIMNVEENLSDIWLNSPKVNTNTAEVFAMAYNIFCEILRET